MQHIYTCNPYNTYIHNIYMHNALHTDTQTTYIQSKTYRQRHNAADRDADAVVPDFLHLLSVLGLLPIQALLDADIFLYCSTDGLTHLVHIYINIYKLPLCLLS